MVMSVWQTLRQCCDHPCLPDLISGADDIDSRDPITYAEESAKIKKIGNHTFCIRLVVDSQARS